MNAEDFITYEQAVALKKLGFREECLFYYYRNMLFSNSDCDPDGGGIYVENLKRSYNKRNNEYIDAPTLAQAQKWLRTEKKLYVYADGVVFDKGDSPKYCITILDVIESHDEIHTKNYGRYNSPEEALSAGITECLNLLNNPEKMKLLKN